MSSARRKFTDDQKLEILHLAGRIGATAALRIHNVSYSVFTKWKLKYNNGNQSPADLDFSNKSRSELKHLTEENITLKKIVADQALELERKEEEIKRSSALYIKARQ